MVSYFHSWHAFWAMGGYAGFVWPAYLIVAGVLVGLAINSLRKSKVFIKKLKRKLC